MAAPPPSEIAYQLANAHQDKGPLYKGIAVFLIILSTVTVVLRFTARYKKKLPVGVDDYLTIPALILCILLCVENIICVSYGVGKHFLVAVDQTKLYLIFKVGFLNSLTSTFSIFFVKMCILFFYKRLFGMRTTWFKWAIWIMMGYVSALATAFFILLIAQCRPITFFWEQYENPPPETGVCTVAVVPSQLGLVIPSIIADFILLALPIGVVAQLKLNWQKKFGVLAIFLVGLLASSAGILRLVTTFGSISDPFDFTWTTGETLTWIAVESNLGLVCACFPVIAPLIPFKSLSTRIGTAPNKSTRKSYGPGNTLPRWQRIDENKHSPSPSSEDESMALKTMASGHSMEVSPDSGTTWDGGNMGGERRGQSEIAYGRHKAIAGGGIQVTREMNVESVPMPSQRY
ncbi:MAG: hypothetical protein MMC33_001243 [Icmadophila ericetorum]|nr:hypothetical protein [Icmadophila ericetorum]